MARRPAWIHHEAVAGALLLATAAWAPAGAAAETPDAWITTKVKVILVTSAEVDAFDVNVDTTGGRVTLHGRVDSAAEKAEAERLARQVEGVREVRNVLEVVPGDVEEVVEAADEEIERHVEAALDAEPDLEGVEVQSVSDGTVVLGGKVDTLSGHLRALEVARGVPGVSRVASEVQSPDQLGDAEIWHDDAAPVAGEHPMMRDAWITSAAKLRLISAEAPAFDINVDTRGGVVTLFGTVGSDTEKRRAGEEVAKVDGVRSVRNELQVVRASQRERVDRRDEDIQATVEQRFEAREDLADADLSVQVANGVVRLTGKVRSQNDRLSALTLARTTEGVRSVVGDLQVERN